MGAMKRPAAEMEYVLCVGLRIGGSGGAGGVIETCHRRGRLRFGLGASGVCDQFSASREGTRRESATLRKIAGKVAVPMPPRGTPPRRIVKSPAPSTSVTAATIK